jgi:hypothetical protein
MFSVFFFGDSFFIEVLSSFLKGALIEKDVAPLELFELRIRMVFFCSKMSLRWSLGGVVRCRSAGAFRDALMDGVSFSSKMSLLRSFSFSF